MAYFARRCAEPQIVADRTSETFVRAAAGFGGFDPARGSAPACPTPLPVQRGGRCGLLEGGPGRPPGDRDGPPGG